MDLKRRIVDELAAGRARSLDLLEPLAPEDLVRQHSPLMSPLIWDLAHIGNYEDLWLLRAVGVDGVGPHLDDTYDAFRHPRRDRPSLDLLDRTATGRYLTDVRSRAVDRLDAVSLDVESPLLRDGFVYGMVVQHEHQHDETLLATLQLMADFAHPDVDGDGAPAPVAPHALTADVAVPGGAHVVGTDDEPWAYDNERPAHVVELEPFRIDTTAVTNREYAAFVEAGGYDDAAHWTDAGWAWRKDEDLVAPQYWRRAANDTWTRRRFGRTEPLPPDEPVQHVCWYEADAYARWSGARLPTEAEWEVAAQGSRGDVADLWRAGRRFAPAPAGWPAGAVSRHGVHGMVGGVWEWTASDFDGYPGFRSFPYREYSEVFFGPDYKVLRGGSWATHPRAARTTFRNWDFPIRRQIFAGFRCARDA
jgi:iron(II)-dependent oxidoreductase